MEKDVKNHRSHLRKTDQGTTKAATAEEEEVNITAADVKKEAHHHHQDIRGNLTDVIMEDIDQGMGGMGVQVKEEGEEAGEHFLLD